jgi:hypothetical protein
MVVFFGGESGLHFGTEADTMRAAAHRQLWELTYAR